MIGTGTEEELSKLMNELNQNNDTIKFDFKYSKHKYRICNCFSLRRHE